MLSPNHHQQLPHHQQAQGPQQCASTTAQHASLERAARSLINLGCELFAKCDSAGSSKVVVAAHEEAMAILDVSHSLITTSNSNTERQAWELAAQHFQIGTELLWEANTASNEEHQEQAPLAPDLYQEDECDVGPRILQAPIRADDDAHAHAAGQTTSTILLEAIILFNKGLIYQSMHRIAEAKQLYEVVIYTVQTMFGATATTPPPCSAAMMELAMRSYNNLGVINYAAAANDDERNEALAASSFETSIHFAKHLSECSKDYRLEYATVLSNWCRACWMRGDIAANSTSSDTLYHRLREILRLRTRLLSWDHADVAAARYNLAVAEYAHRRDGPKAVAQLRQYLAVAAAQQPHGSSTTTIDVLPALILLLLIQNEDKEDHASQDLVRGLRTLQEKRQDLGPYTMEVASVLNFVGTSLFHLQDYDHALIFFQEELRLEDNHKKYFLEEDCGPDESNSISVTCNNIGRILQELGRYPEAIDYYKRALKGEFDDDHDDFQGVTHASIKDSSILAAADAAHSASSSASPSSSSSSTNSPNPSSTVNLFSTIWYNLGLIHDKLGAHSEAINAFKMSLELRRAMFGPDHSDVACLLYNIGVLQMEQGRLDDASASFREALRIRRVDAAGQLNDQHIIKTLEKLTSLHKAKGNIQRALEATREILAVQEVSLEYDEATRVKEVGITLRSVAELHHDVNDLYKAVDTATESANGLRTAVEANLRHLQQQQQTAGSTGHLRDLLLLERFSCVEQLASSLLLLGSLYHELGEPMEASNILREAAVVVQQAKADDDEALAAVQCPPSTSAAALRPSSLLALQEVTATLAICHCAAVA